MKKEIDFLIGQIAKYQLDNNYRYRDCVYKRFYVMYRLQKCKLSLTKIGELLNRHHATVIHGIRMHRRWSRMNDEVYLNSIEAIKAAANELNYEDKYKVSAVEQFNCINLKIQMPWKYDKVNEFKEYMTAKELAEII
jgi:IS30 family transposase